jgi:site-specific recombinase XerD
MRQIKSTKKTLNRRTKKTQVKAVQILSDRQIDAIERVQNLRNKAIILLLINTGLRVSELRNLDYKDCFIDLRTKETVNELKVLGKGNKYRFVPLNKSAKEAIHTIVNYNKLCLKIVNTNRNTPLLISRNSNRLSIAQIQVIFKRELQSHPHIARHTYLTNLRKAGVSGEVIQSIAGHSDYNTTIKYYLSISSEDRLNASRLLDAAQNNKLKLVVNN